ncbi:GNAT family N-acetyltransferase [Labrenzia sp. CE80]|uniref:GNAT family N-acetyltransferase n=1 Tax=Labrenzia sp. CE80 TaxID=1788986 RepID=UPI00138A48BF|nr:GNAT family N-acetyltransferase [Labrenzia sp. CE80]
MRRSLEIFLGGPSSARQLRRLLGEAYLESGQSVSDEQEDVFTRLLVDAAAGRIYLFHYKGAPAGFVTVFFRQSVREGGRVAHFEDLFLRPHLRRLGLGQRMVRAVIQDLKAFGIVSVWSFTRRNAHIEGLFELERFERHHLNAFRRSWTLDDEE